MRRPRSRLLETVGTAHDERIDAENGTRVDGYREDLAAVHAAGFSWLAEAAARELLGRLDGPARVVELGWRRRHDGARAHRRRPRGAHLARKR